MSHFDENYDANQSDNLESIIQQMSIDLIKMTQSSFVYNKVTQNNITTNDSGETYNMFAKTEIKFIESVENITKVDERASYYRILITHYGRCIQNKKINATASQEFQASMRTAIEKLSELDPSYTPPAIPEVKAGCYVATCVYGSYDCPQVWTLRRYRDNTLGSTWYGRLFIRTYYAISPTLVKWFGHTNWFKKLWKGKLDRMVAKLQENGVENTPYEDKNW